jgi:hypothetical protein
MCLLFHHHHHHPPLPWLYDIKFVLAHLVSVHSIHYIVGSIIRSLPNMVLGELAGGLRRAVAPRRVRACASVRLTSVCMSGLRMNRKWYGWLKGE